MNDYKTGFYAPNRKIVIDKDKMWAMVESGRWKLAKVLKKGGVVKYCMQRAIPIKGNESFYDSMMIPKQWKKRSNKW